MSVLCYKKEHFATHQPVLLELLKITDGPVLELGSGLGSSLLFKSFIEDDRHVYSVESSKTWFDQMSALRAPNFHMYFLDAGNEDNDTTGQKWTEFCDKEFGHIEFDIVFIDQSPWTARTHTMNYFLNRAKYVVIHDADYFPVNAHWGKVIHTQKDTSTHVIHSYDFSTVATFSHMYLPPEEFFPMKTGPPTLILSNTVYKEEFRHFIFMLEKMKTVYY